MAAPAAGTSVPRQSGATAYRLLLVLYPRALRDRYGEEMVLACADLRRRDGRRAWARLFLDLAVSVPRARLESVMSAVPTARTVVTVEVVAAVALSLLVLAAVGPWALLLPVALVALGLAQRSRLAGSLDARSGPGDIRSAVAGLAASTVVLIGAVASWLYHIGTYDSLGSTTVVLHNLVAVAALAGVVGSATLLAVRVQRRRGATG